MKWFVYMVVTSRGNLYTGISKDPNRRVYEHNFTSKGSKCLRGQRPVKLVWCAWYNSKSQALSTEYRIKQFSRLEKLRFILSRTDELQISLEELEESLWPNKAADVKYSESDTSALDPEGLAALMARLP